MIFLKILENICEKSKIKNIIIAVILLLETYLYIILLTENDNDFREDLPVSNMKSTINNDIDNILKDELYIVQNMSEEGDGYEIEI